MSEVLTVYKGTDKDMKCHGGFQYELGQTYEDDGAIRCGNKGFHSCEAPLDVLNYFKPSDGSRYFVAEAEGKVDKGSDDSKIASSKLTLKAEIGLPGLAKAQIQYVKNICKDAQEKIAQGESGHAATQGERGHAAAQGNWGHAAAQGERGHAAAQGYSGHAAAQGNWGHAATQGNWGHAATQGNWGHAAAQGESGHAAAQGESGHAAAQGESGHAAAQGNWGHAAAQGNWGHAEVHGKNSIAAAFGKDGMAKAPAGCWIMLAEYDDYFNIIEVRTEKVDGQKIKADTWYTLKNGKFVECE